MELDEKHSFPIIPHKIEVFIIGLETEKQIYKLLLYKDQQRSWEKWAVKKRSPSDSISTVSSSI